VGSALALVTLYALAAVSNLSAAPPDFELPGTQPTTFGNPSAQILHLFVPPEGHSDACSNCHAADPLLGRPLEAWQGSMMSQSARDPLFYAQLDLALADHLVRPEVDGMADMCLRCHSPVGWLEGRSTDTTGMGFNVKDLFGVQCHACHRLVDPELIGTPADPDTVNILAPLAAAFEVPTTFGNGMFVMDPKQVRRGPYDESQLTAHGFSYVGTDILWTSVGDVAVDAHPVLGSPFHRSSNLCGTCHDVSNPTDCLTGFDKEDTQKCFPIERTWTEWRHSAYATMGEAGNCQSCHMSGPLNGVAFGEPCEGAAALGHLNDIHFHDLTGGNAFVPAMIRDMKERYETPVGALCGVDAACTSAENAFKAAIEGLYPPVGGSPFLDVDVSALEAGIERVHRTLRRAAFLEVTSTAPDLVVQVENRTGHKLPTGYPEGRRMWLQARFLDAGGGLLAESGRYETTSAALFHDQNLDGLAGPKSYDVVGYTDDSGAALASGRPTKVWEARLDHDPAAGPPIEFHFALNDQVLMDNRIPPQGWDPVGYGNDRALPVIPALYATNGWQGDYGAGGGTPESHDEVTYELPPSTDRVELALYYQTTSREYAEALLADNPGTLTAGGYDRGSLFHEGWERVGKSEPVQMVRRVAAILDGDGDGLSDGWEAGFLAAAPAAERGYNDDPDADGRPNWQEFQEGTHPMDPASPAGAVARDPVDIVLVLDMSGSMNDPAPGAASGTPKIDILKSAVTLFLETWRDYAIPEDRIGVVYFRTNAVPYGAAPLLESFVAEWQNIDTDVQSQTASGWTAMGAGLYTAVQGLGAFDPADPRERHVILFSNGMQNRSPMISVDPLDLFPDHLYIRDQTPAENPDVTGGSNVTIGGSNFLIPISAGDLVHVHTVGIGVAENSGGTAWHQLLFDLATQQSGKHNFVTRAAELEGVFLEDLVEALRGNTPEYVLERQLTLEAGGEASIEFPVNASAERFSVVVAWDERQRFAPTIALERPDGVAENVGRIVRGADRYRILTRYLTDADRAPGDFGTWRLTLGSRLGAAEGEKAAALERGALPVRVHVLVEDAELEYRFAVSARRLRVGEPLRVTAQAQIGARFVRNLETVEVRVRRPNASVGELLARSKAKPQAAAADPDLTSSPFGALLAASFAEESFARRLRPESSLQELRDDGVGGDDVAADGLYAAILPTPTVPGHYQLDFRIAGTLPDGRPFTREETRDLVVQIGLLDADRSQVHRRRSGGSWQAFFTPRDASGRLLGPGYHDQIAAYVGGVRRTIHDRLDGSYRIELPPGYFPSQPVTLVHQGITFFDGPVERRPIAERIPLWLWLLLLLLLLLLLVAWWLRRS
jgi:hypothetical protein